MGGTSKPYFSTTKWTQPVVYKLKRSGTSVSPNLSYLHMQCRMFIWMSELSLVVHSVYFSDSRSWSHPPLQPPALMCHETSVNESIGFSSSSCKSDFILILANLKFFMPFGHMKAVLFSILHFTINESVCIRWMPPTSMPWILARILDSWEQPSIWEIVLSTEHNPVWWYQCITLSLLITYSKFLPRYETFFYLMCEDGFTCSSIEKLRGLLPWLGIVLENKNSSWSPV